MFNVPACLTSGLVALSLVASPAPAQSSGEWLFKTALELQTLVFRPACQGDTPIEDIYILGVRDPGDILTESEETRIVAEMSDFFSARMPFTVTKADNFGAIAESYTGNAQADIDELSRAMRAASRAGLTVVIEPFARQGTEVEAEVRAWTRAGADVSCAPSFRTRIPTGTEDPACARNYKMAQEDGSVSALKFFIAYSGHCPEVHLAGQRMRALEDEAARQSAFAACRQGFQSAVAARTEAALGEFIARNPDCPEISAAQTMRDAAAQTESCDRAYQDAQLTNSEDGYEGFLRRHGGCAQAAAARLVLDALRAQSAATAQPQAPAVTTPQVTTTAPQPAATPTWRVKPSVSGGYMNVRAGPGTMHGIVFSIPAGSSGMRLSQCRPADPGGGRYNWCVVEWRGQIGWSSVSGYEQVMSAPIVTAPVAPTPVPQFANQCDALWYQRNLIYDQAGYCFKSARGAAVFDNSNCTGGQPSAAGVAQAQRIKRQEQSLGCP